jgi:hypothetical protein
LRPIKKWDAGPGYAAHLPFRESAMARPESVHNFSLHRLGRRPYRRAAAALPLMLAIVCALAFLFG